MRSKLANSCGADSMVYRLSSTVSKCASFSMVYLIACMGFSSHSPGGGFVSLLPGCAALVPRHCAGCPPALERVLYARTVAQIARGRRRVYSCQRSGAGFGAGCLMPCRRGGRCRGAVRLPGTYIIPQFALFGKCENGLFSGVFGGLRLLGCC